MCQAEQESSIDRGNKDQAEQCHILPGGSRLDTTLAVPVKKRKAEVMVEAPDKKKKFVFNKRGKLKEDELKELSRTNKNIFSWLKPKSKPTHTPVYMLAKVMEVEVEDMDVVDTVREERLERVRIPDAMQGAGQ